MDARKSEDIVRFTNRNVPGYGAAKGWTSTTKNSEVNEDEAEVIKEMEAVVVMLKSKG